MKNLICLTVNIFFFSSLYAQMPQAENVTVTWGKDFGTEQEMEYIIAQDSQYLYTSSISKAKVFGYRAPALTKFDTALNRVLEKELDIKIPGEGLLKTYEGVLVFGSDLMLLTRFNNRAHKKTYFFVQKMNEESLTPEEHMHKIAEIPFSMSMNSGNIFYTYSPDDSKVALVLLHPTKNNQPAKLSIVVLDENVQELWTTEWSLPAKRKLLDMHHVVIDNQGNAAVLCKQYLGGGNDQEEFKGGAANYQYHLNLISGNGRNQKQHTIQPDGYRVDDLNLVISEEDLYVMGLYSEATKNKPALQGVFVLQFDKNKGTIKASEEHVFDARFFTESLPAGQSAKVGQKIAEGKGSDLNQVKQWDVVRHENGEITVFGEVEYVKTKTSSSPNRSTSSTRHYYHHEDIVVAHFNPEGVLQWTKRIPRRQKTMNDRGAYSSFALVVSDQYLRLIFNSHLKNLNTSETYEVGKIEPFNGKQEDSFAELVTLDRESGEFTRSMLYRNVRKMIMPSLSASPEPGTIYLYHGVSTYYQFNKVVFE